MPAAENALPWFSLWPLLIPLPAPVICSILLKEPHPHTNCIFQLIKLRTSKDEATWTRGDCSSGPF